MSSYKCSVHRQEQEPTARWGSGLLTEWTIFYPSVWTLESDIPGFEFLLCHLLTALDEQLTFFALGDSASPFVSDVRIEQYILEHLFCSIHKSI